MKGCLMPTTDEFETSDLGEAAFLVAKSLPLLRVEHGPVRATFVFPGAAARVAPAFRLPGSNLVDAKRFHAALRELRGLARGEVRR
jgi:hypothetical protein